MYKYVLFDLDGTLLDSSEGIERCYRYAFEQLGLPFPGESFMRNAIGRMLPEAFEKLAGLSPQDARRAVEIYRDRYNEEGKSHFHVYPGMNDALQALQMQGCCLGVATLKKEDFAREMLALSGLLPLFHTVCGMDTDDTLTKPMLIERCRLEMNAPPEETVLIGDTVFDQIAAQDAGIAFLPVTYGFGFQGKEKPKTPAANSPDEIPQILNQIK